MDFTENIRHSRRLGPMRGAPDLRQRAEALLASSDRRKAKPAKGQTTVGVRRASEASQGAVDVAAIRALAFEELLSKLYLESVRIPEFALKLGLKDINLAAALPEMFIGFVFLFAGDDIADQAYDVDDDLPPQVEADYQVLARQYGLKVHDPARTLRHLEQFDVVVHGDPPIAA